MARGRSSRSRTAYGSPIASPGLVRIPVRLAPLSRLSASSLIQYEDRRMFHPLGVFRPALATVRGASRVVLRSPPARPSFFPQDVLKFADPTRVLVCARRKMRREVLFAKRKFGGRGGNKRFNYWSRISCRSH